MIRTRGADSGRHTTTSRSWLCKTSVLQIARTFADAFVHFPGATIDQSGCEKLNVLSRALRFADIDALRTTHQADRGRDYLRRAGVRVKLENLRRSRVFSISNLSITGRSLADHPSRPSPLTLKTASLVVPRQNSRLRREEGRQLVHLLVVVALRNLRHYARVLRWSCAECSHARNKVGRL